MACRLVSTKPLSAPNAGILLIWPPGTNFSEISIEIHISSLNMLKKIHMKLSSAKCRPFCLGLNVLMTWQLALNRRQPLPKSHHPVSCKPLSEQVGFIYSTHWQNWMQFHWVSRGLMNTYTKENFGFFLKTSNCLTFLPQIVKNILSWPPKS